MLCLPVASAGEFPVYTGHRCEKTPLPQITAPGSAGSEPGTAPNYCWLGTRSGTPASPGPGTAAPVFQNQGQRLGVSEPGTAPPCFRTRDSSSGDSEPGTATSSCFSTRGNDLTVSGPGTAPHGCFRASGNTCFLFSCFWPFRLKSGLGGPHSSRDFSFSGLKICTNVSCL